MKFIFGRSLPEPFDKGTKKVKVSSKYGDGTEATLSTTAVKGILAYCKCKDRTMEGAVGCSGTKCVAEYKSATGPDVYHIAVYDPATGSIMDRKSAAPSLALLCIWYVSIISVFLS